MIKNIINGKKKITFFIAIILVAILGVTLGTALLSSTLSINGTSTVKKNSWKIYFDGVEIANDSAPNENEEDDAKIVMDGADGISSTKQNIEFTANLKKPGDFYEFTVYTVNDGDIDAEVVSVVKEGLTEEQQKYLEFEVKYDNGTEIKPCDILYRKNHPEPQTHPNRRLIKAVVRYKTGLEPDEYPQDGVSVNLSFKINYSQNVDCTPVEDPEVYKLTIRPNGGTFEDGTTTKSFKIVENQMIYRYDYGSIIYTTDNKCYDSFWYECDATAKHDSTKYYKDHPMLYFADNNPSVYNTYGYNEADLYRFYLNNVQDPSWDITPEPYENGDATNYSDSSRLTTDVNLCRGYTPSYAMVLYFKNLHNGTVSGGGNAGWERFVVGATNNHFSNRNIVRSGYTQTGWSEAVWTYKTQGEYTMTNPISDAWIISHEQEDCGSIDIYATWS